MTFKTGKYLFLAANAFCAVLNVSVVIMSYNEEGFIGWEWNALAVLVSIASFVWVLSWRASHE